MEAAFIGLPQSSPSSATASAPRSRSFSVLSAARARIENVSMVSQPKRRSRLFEFPSRLRLLRFVLSSPAGPPLAPETTPEIDASWRAATLELEDTISALLACGF